MAKQGEPLKLTEPESVIKIERKQPRSKSPMIAAALIAAIGIGFGAGRFTAPAGGRRSAGFGPGGAGQSFDPAASGFPGGPGGGGFGGGPGGAGTTSLDVTVTSVSGTTITATTANGTTVTFSLADGATVTKADPADASMLTAGASASVTVTRAALRTIFNGGGDLGSVSGVLVHP
jgi:hypothetical protein